MRRSASIYVTSRGERVPASRTAEAGRSRAGDLTRTYRGRLAVFAGHRPSAQAVETARLKAAELEQQGVTAKEANRLSWLRESAWMQVYLAIRDEASSIPAASPYSKSSLLVDKYDLCKDAMDDPQIKALAFAAAEAAGTDRLGVHRTALRDCLIEKGFSIAAYARAAEQGHTEKKS